MFDSYADWERFAERLVELGLADTDHPHLVGRPPPPALRDARAAHAGPADPSRDDASPSPRCSGRWWPRAEPGSPADRGVFAQNRWAALRFGAEAKLVHPDGDRLASVPELLEELLGRVGLDGDKHVRALVELDQAGHAARARAP